MGLSNGEKPTDSGPQALCVMRGVFVRAGGVAFRGRVPGFLGFRGPGAGGYRVALV